MDAYPHRMRDLVRLTGVSAPTIHFYAQQGLLPEASKTAENQARYPDATVTRIGWIRSVQNELRLSLRAIGWILEHHGELPAADVASILSLYRVLEEPDPAASTDELARMRQRLDDADVEALIRLGLVGGADGTISDSDVHLLGIVAALRRAGFSEAAGFSIDALAIYRDAVERLIVDELHQFLQPLVAVKEPDDLRELVRHGLPLAEQLLGVLHRRAVHSEVQRRLGNDLTEPRQTA